MKDHSFPHLTPKEEQELLTKPKQHLRLILLILLCFLFITCLVVDIFGISLFFG